MKANLYLRRGEVEPHQSQLIVGFFRNVRRWYVGERELQFSKRKWKCRVLYSGYSKHECVRYAKDVWKTNPLRYHFQ